MRFTMADDFGSVGKRVFCSKIRLAVLFDGSSCSAARPWRSALLEPRVLRLARQYAPERCAVVQRRCQLALVAHGSTNPAAKLAALRQGHFQIRIHAAPGTIEDENGAQPVTSNSQPATYFRVSNQQPATSNLFSGRCSAQSIEDCQGGYQGMKRTRPGPKQDMETRLAFWPIHPMMR